MENIIQPIVVMYVPKDFEWQSGGMVIRPLDLMRELNGWGSPERWETRKSLGGYMWFVFVKDDITVPDIQIKKATKINKGEIENILKLIEEFKNDTSSKK